MSWVTSMFGGPTEAATAGTATGAATTGAATGAATSPLWATGTPGATSGLALTETAGATAPAYTAMSAGGPVAGEAYTFGGQGAFAPGSYDAMAAAGGEGGAFAADPSQVYGQPSYAPTGSESAFQPGGYESFAKAGGYGQGYEAKDGGGGFDYERKQGGGGKKREIGEDNLDISRPSGKYSKPERFQLQMTRPIEFRNRGAFMGDF